MRMRRILGYIFYVLLIVAIGLAIGLALQTKNNSTTKKSPIHVTQPAKVTSDYKTPATSNNSGNNQSSSSQNKLTNTGPGDVLVLFVSSSLIFSLIHWRYNARKLY